MKIFISWSGDQSQKLARELAEWIPTVLQRVETFMSSRDIEGRWPIELGERLDEINFGIICLTPENLQSPWIHYEAGAIAKSLTTGNVRPIRFGISTNDVKWPLAQFQSIAFEQSDMSSLINYINRRLELPLDAERLGKSFDAFWPEFETRLNAIVAEDAPAPIPRRTDSELLEELLAIARNQQRRSSERFDPGSNWRLALRGPGSSFFDFEELAVGLAMLKTLAEIERLEYHKPNRALVHTLVKMRGPIEALLREVEVPPIYSLFFKEDNDQLWITYEKNGQSELQLLE